MAAKEEIYILNEGGETLFMFSSLGSGDEMENQNFLTASYLTAVLQFAKAASGNLISELNLGKATVLLKIGQNIPLTYVYVVDKSKKYNKKKIDKMMDQIVEQFEENFKENALKWDGGIDHFTPFIPMVKKILRIK